MSLARGRSELVQSLHDYYAYHIACQVVAHDHVRPKVREVTHVPVEVNE